MSVEIYGILGSFHIVMMRNIVCCYSFQGN